MTRQIKIAVIPAAGMGTRMSELPLTKILPKPMLPLLNKPILEHIITWLKNIGIQNVYLIVSFKKEVFKDYFGNGSDFGIKIEYIECPDPQNIGGLADGINLLSKKIKEPFITVLGDDFTVADYNHLVKSFFDHKALVLEAVVKEDDNEALRRTCSVLISKTGKIEDIIEKPQIPQWKMRGCGIYVFDPLVFEFIEKTPLKDGKRNITDTIQLISRQNGRAFGFKVQKNININTLKDLEQATFELLRKK